MVPRKLKRNIKTRHKWVPLEKKILGRVLWFKKCLEITALEEYSTLNINLILLQNKQIHYYFHVAIMPSHSCKAQAEVVLIVVDWQCCDWLEHAELLSCAIMWQEWTSWHVSVQSSRPLKLLSSAKAQAPFKRMWEFASIPLRTHVMQHDSTFLKLYDNLWRRFT